MCIEEDIQLEILKNGPVQAAFDIYEDFMVYTNGKGWNDERLYILHLTLNAKGFHGQSQYFRYVFYTGLSYSLSSNEHTLGASALNST